MKCWATFCHKHCSKKEYNYKGHQLFWVVQGENGQIYGQLSNARWQLIRQIKQRKMWTLHQLFGSRQPPAQRPLSILCHRPLAVGQVWCWRFNIDAMCSMTEFVPAVRSLYMYNIFHRPCPLPILWLTWKITKQQKGYRRTRVNNAMRCPAWWRWR